MSDKLRNRNLRGESMEREFEILIVDDDVELASNLKDILEEKGYPVAVAHNGQTALALFREKIFDLALIDMRLPDMPGRELIGQLAALSPRTEYMIITGYASLEGAVEAVREKCILAYEIKPIDIDRLVSFVDQVAQRRQAEEALRRQAADLQEYATMLEANNDITLRQQAEKVLQESEERYRLLFNSGNDAIFVFPLDELIMLPGKFTEVNDKARELLGYTREELLQLSPFDLEPPEKHEYFPALVEKIVAEGNFLYETEAITKDGRLIPLEISLRRFVDLQDHPTGLAIARDITLRKQTEEALRESESLLHSLFDYMHDAMIILNWDGSILFANQAAARIIELERPEEVVGHNMVEYLHPDSLQKAAEDLEAVKADKMGFLSEYQLCSVTGRCIWVESMGGKIIFRNAFANLVCIRDITERKRAEAALRESEEKYRWVLDNMADVIAVIDMNLRFTYVSPSIMRIRGYTDEETVAQTFEQAMTPESLQIVVKVFEEEMKLEASGTADPGRSRILELELYRKDGSIVCMENHLSFLRDEAQKAVGMIALGRDITDRKKAEDRLRASLREKEVLLKEIHHRVKNNLQVVSSLLNLQSEYIKDEKVLGVLQESQNRVRTMAAIHGKLYQSSDLSRIDVAGYLHDLAIDLFRSYGVSLENIALQVNIADIPLSIGTAIPLGLILNELVSNSLRYAFPEGCKGEIHIDLYSDDGKIAMVVADNGSGFPHDLDFRDTKSLGLQLVIALTEQLDGAIELRREGGTAFALTFPQEINYRDE